MRLILDIDHTVLNTLALKRALAHCAEDVGVSSQIFWKAYHQLRRDGAFSPEQMVRHLPERFGRSASQLQQRYHRVILDVEQYLYADAEYFFRWAQTMHHPITLYTYGERSVQQEKIRTLRKRYRIHRAVITSDRTKRRDFLSCIEKREPWVWIDDFCDVPVTNLMFREGTLLYLRRRKTQLRHSNLPTVKNLYQAVRWLQRHFPEFYATHR